MEWASDTKDNKLANSMILATVLVSVLPLTLTLLGIDFGKPSNVHNLPDLSGNEGAIVESLSGTFIHLILEWSGVIIAMATAVLAFVQYRITGNSATPIIGMALLSAGFMDAFHVLSASKLIYAVTDNSNFAPFTWGLSRMFQALILFIGVGIFIFGPKNKKKHRNRLVYVSSLTFLIVSYLTIRLCASSDNLPSSQFPNQWITRPYDVAPLILFIVLAVWAFPKFRKMENSIFSHALIWGMVPAIATQLHMAFGSSELYDSHFNMAHFLKTVSYAVPFIGIAIDYLSTYRAQNVRLAEITIARKRLEAKNIELNQISYATSHDLQEPLRTLMSMCDLLTEEYKGKLDHFGDEILGYIKQSSKRMSDLVKDLMTYNSIGRNNELTMIDCEKIIKTILADLSKSIAESEAKIQVAKLPVISGYKTEIRLLFQHLISNSIKFRSKEKPPFISISAFENTSEWGFSICDNGIGIAPKHQEKIFQIFQKLSNRGVYDGTGVGLAHCKKIIDHHDGRIWVESDGIEGCTFHFTIPKKTMQ